MQEELSKPSEISLRDYLDVLRRRKAILIQTFVLVFVVGVLVTFMTKPLYRTGTSIVVEGKSYYVSQFDSTNPMSALFSADAGHDVDTQLQVIQGENIVTGTYGAANVPPGTVKLQVKQSGTTDILDITTESNTPVYAQRFANALPTIYKDYVQGNRGAEIDNALVFATERRDKESTALQKAEEELERFREKSHVADIATERTSRINNKMAAEVDVQKAAGVVAGLQTRQDVLQKTQQAIPPFVDTPTTVTNPQLQVLRDQIATLETQKQGLLVLFKPSHTKVQEVDAQIVHIQERLAQMPLMTTSVQRAPNPLVSQMAEKIASTRTELAEAQALLARAREHAAEDAGGLNKYGKLDRTQERIQRDIDKHQAALTLLNKNVDDLQIRKKATHDPVMIISPAGPAMQVAPKPMFNILAASVIGLVLGLCFALMQEFMDDRINTPEEAKAIFGVPALGYIPMVEESEGRRLGNSRSGNLLETYRVLRTNVMFSAIDAPIQSILVTSTVPGEGKSTTAFNLAVAMAMDGKRVILVDADLRRPTVHKSCGLERRPGLTNVLVGDLALDEALQNTHVPNLRVLTAGPLPPNPAEMLNSTFMRKIHASLRERADIIIYDTPPCLATADAQVLSADVDGVLYVAQFGETKKSAMRRAAELLAQAHVRVLGVVFNKIDITGNRDDYYSGYYRYYNYYQGDGNASEDGAMRPLSTSEFDLLLQQREGAQAMARTEDDQQTSGLAVVRSEEKATGVQDKVEEKNT